jgi:hypothetical protein
MADEAEKRVAVDGNSSAEIDADASIEPLPTEQTQTEVTGREEAFKPDRHFWLALSPLTVLALMTSLDATSVSVALPVSSHGAAREPCHDELCFFPPSALCLRVRQSSVSTPF